MTETTRDKLIRLSIQLMSTKGFNNTGIAEILALAEVPKGSFYHYFKSKDDLGFAIIDHYGGQLGQGFSDFIGQSSGSALERLRAYFVTVIDLFEHNFGACNCLLGNLAQELAQQNPEMRQAIFVQYQQLEHKIAAQLQQAQQQAELSLTADPQRLAPMLFASWQGCLVRARLQNSAEPLREWLQLYFERLLTR